MKNFLQAFLVWVVFLTAMCCFSQKRISDTIDVNYATTYLSPLKMDGLFVGDSLLFYIDKKGKLIVNPALLCDCRKCIKKRKKSK